MPSDILNTKAEIIILNLKLFLKIILQIKSSTHKEITLHEQEIVELTENKNRYTKT